MEVARKEASPQYNYILKKTKIPETCVHANHGDMCGICFWKGVTIPAEVILECRTCKEDNENFGRLVKDNPRAKNYEFEPDCVKACIWWDWFHNNRKLKCGCNCETVCVCGKLKYIDKKETGNQYTPKEEAKKKVKNNKKK